MEDRKEVYETPEIVEIGKTIEVTEGWKSGKVYEG